MRYINKIFNLVLVVFSFIFISGCAHTMNISSYNIDDMHQEEQKIQKNIVYIITDTDRNKEVTTPGGGGDSCSYFPYKDIERGYRVVLKSIFSNVTVSSSANDYVKFKDKGIDYIFVPEIYTQSKSESSFTWPPTDFTIDLISNVTDNSGKIIAHIKVTGAGKAEFSEFKQDFGLAGSRAVKDALVKFSEAVRSNPQLGIAPPN